jgi:hypothetical protein
MYDLRKFFYDAFCANLNLAASEGMDDSPRVYYRPVADSNIAPVSVQERRESRP